ncbi:hypothetical protein ACFV14_26605 [Streptomyces zaomyceticus]|uniref:hypothetical protein n=1 Tax=Streptomyces zaomyceticus TaxID=68286 RepID=UPI0036C0A88F
MLDLVLRTVDVDRFVVAVDPLDDAGGEQDVPVEDPYTDVDDDVAAPGLVRVLVDLPDVRRSPRP